MNESGQVPLHPLEEKVLSGLADGRALEFDSVVASTHLLPDQVRRSLSWLSSKGLVKLTEKSTSTVKVKSRPPELLLLDRLTERGGSAPMEEMKRSFPSPQEFTAAVGRATSSGWVKVSTEPSGPLLKTSNPEGAGGLRDLLASLVGEVDESTIPKEQHPLVAELIRRGALLRTHSKKISVAITREGKSAIAGFKKQDYLERLTPEALSSIRSSGIAPALRPIDVTAPAMGFYPGRRHPVKEFINEVREVYLSMGFSEIVGDSVQSSFWNFDALFTPQDHPARELQDTFYIKGGVDRNLKREGAVAEVALAHENGGKTGSKGWRYTWNIEEARRLVLRTHNTALTIKATMDSGDSESRVFSVGRVYRNENLDYKHLAELHQMEGIVIGDRVTLRDLMGVLTQFYGKLGMKGVKLWPSYFPYTEPSMQVMVYYERVGKWLEMGGSGMFRPEVTAPLGVKKPVIAWGCGLERLLMLRLGIQDIRELYNSDIAWLRGRRETASSQDIL